MPSNESRKSLAAVIEKYQNQVGEVLPYLAERGITVQAAERFKLGYVTPETDGPTRGRLAIPYLTAAGPWHVKYRCIEDHNCKDLKHGKYVYDPGSQQHLFNAPTLLSATRVVVVEGELDAVAAEQAGVNAVAYPGADTWQKNRHWRFCFDCVEQVTVVADGDDPGRKAANTVAESIRAGITGDVSVIELPDGHDTNSFLVEHGELDYLDRIGWL